MPSMHKYISIILILLFNYKSLAIDLHSALSSAYDNNDGLQSLRRQFLSDIEQFSQAFSEFLPQIYLEMNDQNTKSKFSSQQAINEGATNRDPVHTQYGNFTISQNVFNGGASMAKLKAAQEAFKALRAQYYANEQEAISNLIKNYLDCYAAKEKYEIAEIRVQYLQQQLDSIQEKLRLGEATTIDLAMARTALASGETERLTQYANYQAAKAFFVQEFGIVPDNIILPTIPENLPPSLESITQRAILVNPMVDTAKYSVNQSKASELAAKSALLPQVNLKLQQGKNFYNPQSNYNGYNNNSTTSSVYVYIPIYDQGVEYSRIRKSKHATRLAVIQLDNAIRQVRANAISAWEDYEAAKSKIIATAQGLESAQLSYDGRVQEQLVGAKTILDVLSAGDDLNNAKIARVDAYTSSIMSAYRMKALVGELTARSLKLKVKYFTPEEAFKTLKKKLFIGF